MPSFGAAFLFLPPLSAAGGKTLLNCKAGEPMQNLPRVLGAKRKTICRKNAWLSRSFFDLQFSFVRWLTQRVSVPHVLESRQGAATLLNRG